MVAPASRRSGKDDPRVGRFVLFVFLGILLLVPIGMLRTAIIDIGPASTARDNQGVPGVYRVTDAHCGQKGCFVFGDFTISGQSTPWLADVSIQADTTLSTGQSVPAEWVDGNVYPAGSGSAWSRDVLFFVLGPLGLLLWAWLVVWRPLRRRRGLAWRELWAPLPKR